MIFKGFSKSPSNNTPTNSSKSLPTTSIQNEPPLLPKSPKTLPIKKLSPSELQIWCDKGLFYNCDDRYFSGHKCKSQYFVPLEQEEDSIHDKIPDELIELAQEDLPKLACMLCKAIQAQRH